MSDIMMKRMVHLLRHASRGAWLCLALAAFPVLQAKAGFEYMPMAQGMGAGPAAVSASTMAGLTDADIIQGGADNVPLSVAMRQILPPQVGFAPGEGVDMSRPVSWKGGRPWRLVMNDVLASAGLTAVESGNVFLLHATSAPLMAAVPAPVPYADPAPVSEPVPAMRLAQVGPGEPGSGMPMMSSPAAGMPVMLDGYGSGSSAGSGTETWTGERGMTLRTILQDWSRRANVELHWSTNFDYPVLAAVSIQGTYEDAVRTLLTGFEKAAPEPLARLHTNMNAGRPALVVETRGNNYGE
ncbi:MAG: toxin co-regulated pilus biosynthesis Q family protein [Pseudomonadota bacterium]|nr:toxin co-regulated pilus biosynthesis Q family protein [Pseudomonadota bacterium]